MTEQHPITPPPEPMIPDHYRGNDIRVYREGFHAGYKYAFQLTEKHSDTPPPELVEQWRTPRPVNDVDLAFPASVIGNYIPAWEELPMPFQEFTSGYEELASYACSHSVELRPEVLIEGIEADTATRQLSAVARSFEPKHEHKQAAMAFLLSLWLKSEVQP